MFIVPHNDDAPLFGAFTLQREQPLVLTIFDSFTQVDRGHLTCDAVTRRLEDMEAVALLGCKIAFSGVPDNLPETAMRERVYEALRRWEPTEVWLPAVEEGGHLQHNLVAEIGLEVYRGANIHRYLTYTQKGGKSISGQMVTPTGAMVRKKLQALACYRTQIEIDEVGCWPHFIRDQNEYVLD